MSTKTVAFFGLGNMGRPMALNLSKAGFRVVGYDVSAACLDAAKALGLEVAKNPLVAVESADFVFSMLPASQHVLDLYGGQNQELLKGIPKQALIVDSSTISPQAAKEVSMMAESQGKAMIDAPVSGGTGGAQAGTLTFMVGGTPQDFERSKALLAPMGKNFFYAGASGSGQIAKVCNNMLLAIHMIGTAEALALGKNLGMDPKVLSEIMSKSSGRNWSLEVYNPYPGVQAGVPASKNYEGGFMVDLMTKDLGLAIEAGLQSQTSLPLGSVARSLYQTLRSAGLGKKDFSVVQTFLNSVS
jgi:3-hydroxyisobutyrate dehydrogenase